MNGKGSLATWHQQNKKKKGALSPLSPSSSAPCIATCSAIFGIRHGCQGELSDGRVNADGAERGGNVLSLSADADTSDPSSPRSSAPLRVPALLPDSYFRQTQHAKYLPPSFCLRPHGSQYLTAIPIKASLKASECVCCKYDYARRKVASIF